MNDIEQKLWAEMYVLQSAQNEKTASYGCSQTMPEVAADEAVEALRKRIKDELSVSDQHYVNVSCENRFHRRSHRERKSCVRPVTDNT